MDCESLPLILEVWTLTDGICHVCHYLVRWFGTSGVCQHYELDVDIMWSQEFYVVYCETMKGLCWIQHDHTAPPARRPYKVQLEQTNSSSLGLGGDHWDPLFKKVRCCPSLYQRTNRRTFLGERRSGQDNQCSTPSISLLMLIPKVLQASLERCKLCNKLSFGSSHQLVLHHDMRPAMLAFPPGTHRLWQIRCLSPSKNTLFRKGKVSNAVNDNKINKDLRLRKLAKANTVDTPRILTVPSFSPILLIHDAPMTIASVPEWRGAERTA